MLDAWRRGADVVYAVRESRRGETRFKLATRALVLPAVRQARPDRARGGLRRLPADGPRAARRAPLDARAQPLPARHDRLGRLHPDRGPVLARGALRRPDEVHRPRTCCASRFDAITSFSHAPLQAATLLGFVFSRARLPRDPAGDRRALRRHLLARRAVDARDRPAARRDPADHRRHHRRVRRADLRRGQAPAAVRRARARQRRGARPARALAGCREDRRSSAPGCAGSPPPTGSRATATRSTSTSAGRGSAARRRRSTSATGTGSSATTTTSSPPTPTSPTCSTSWGCRTRSSGGRRAWRSSRAGALHPFITPLDLLRFGPLSPPARVRMGAAVLALQRFAGDRAPYERITARAWIERRMGRQAWDEVWGPLLRGKFGERADDIAMVWLWSKLRLRRSVKGEDVRQERLGYPRASWEALFGALERSVEAGGGRVLTDTPAARIERAGDGPARDLRRARTRSGRGTTRAGSRPAGDAVYDRVLATVPNDVFAQLLDAGAGRRGGGGLPRARGVDRVLRRALPAARARPRVQPVLLDQRRRPRAALRRADRAHELRRAGALRRSPLPLRRQLPAARARAARARRRRAARPLRGGPAGGQPGVLARLGAARVAVRRARRAADRHRRLRARGSRRSRPRPQAWRSRTRRRSIPRTAGRTTPCGWAPRRRRP